jgi:MFS family permease
MSQSELRDLFKVRMYMRFVAARFFGGTASQMLMVALGWQMYDLTGSAWDLGLVGLAQFVPALLMTLPAGQVADRVNRARLYSNLMGLQVLIALTLWASTTFGWVSREVILLVSVALGAVRAFHMPAQQSLTPLLVPRHLLQRGVAFASSVMQVSFIGGPALGGLLYAWGASTVYAVCCSLVLLGFVLTWWVHVKQAPPEGAVSWSSALSGLQFMWHNKLLLGVTTLDLFAVLLGGATALLPIYAKDILHVGPEGLGVLRAAPAVGALVMAGVLTRWPIQRHAGPRLLQAVALFGVATVVFGLSTSFVLSFVALVVTGAADSVSVVTRMTVMQLETPDHIRGRVSAVNGIFIGASNQLGEFESGAVAALFGAVVSVVSGGVGTVLVAGLWSRWFPALGKLDRVNDLNPSKSG